MKTSCPHCGQHLAHDPPAKPAAVACPSCGQPVLIRARRSRLWLGVVLAVVVLVIVLVFGAVIDGMERDRQREDALAEHRRQRSEYYVNKAAAVQSRADLLELQIEMRREREATARR